MCFLSFRLSDLVVFPLRCAPWGSRAWPSPCGFAGSRPRAWAPRPCHGPYHFWYFVWKSKKLPHLSIWKVFCFWLWTRRVFRFWSRYVSGHFCPKDSNRNVVKRFRQVLFPSLFLFQGALLRDPNHPGGRQLWWLPGSAVPRGTCHWVVSGVRNLKSSHGMLKVTLKWRHHKWTSQLSRDIAANCKSRKATGS